MKDILEKVSRGSLCCDACRANICFGLFGEDILCLGSLRKIPMQETQVENYLESVSLNVITHWN
jgi:hypothetical protein